MNRRTFFRVLGAFPAAGWIPALAQQRPKVVGVLLQGGAYRVGLDGLRQVLETDAPRDSIRLLVRESGGDRDAIKKAAAELEKDGADLLVTFSTTVSIAAKEVTQRIPIVFVAGSDPVEYRLIQSISHPGDRLTGVASFRTEITPKRFALLKEMIPGLKRVMTFHNPSSPDSVVAGLDHARKAAAALGIDLLVREVHAPAEVRAALDGIVPGEADAFFFPNDSMILSESQTIIERATALRMSTMAQYLGLVSDGALAGYGLDFRDEGRLAAKYVLRILGGTSPSELPVEVNERHILGVNLRTARALGLTIPPTLLARADEVIE